MAMTIPILILLKAAIAVTVLHGGSPGPDPDTEPKKVVEIPACHHSDVCGPPHKVIKVACSHEAPKLAGPRCDPSDRMDDLLAPPEPDPGALAPTPEPEPDDGADHPADDDRDRPAPEERHDDDGRPHDPEVPGAEDGDRDEDDDRRPRDPEVPGAEDDDREPEPPSESEPQPSMGFGAQG